MRGRVNNLALQLRAAAERNDALRADLDQEFATLIGTNRDAHDVMDALWWAAHPLQPTPAGEIDPAVHLVELQSSVFSRAAMPEPTLERTEAGSTVRATASEHRLRQLTVHLAARADAVAQLLERFGTDLTDAGATTMAVTKDLASGVAAPPPADGSTNAVTDDRPLAGRVRWRSILLAAGVAAGVLGTLGAQALQQGIMATFENGSSATAGPSSAENTPGVLPNEAAVGAIAGLFDQPVDPSAGELADLGPSYSMVRPSGLTPRGSYGIYLARLGSGPYCLVVQQVDLTATSICAAASEIAENGLRLNAVVLGTLDPEATGPRVLLDLTATWLADGMVMSSTSPHVPTVSAYVAP